MQVVARTIRTIKACSIATVVAGSLLGGAACTRSATAPVAPPAPARSPAGAQSTLNFTDITAGSGIQFAYRNGQASDHCAILESLGGGVGLLDFDLDGLLDVCLPGGGTIANDKRIGGLPNGLFRNLGQNQFAQAEQAGLSPCSFYSHGAAVGDYNNDGFPDLLIGGYGAIALWTNQGDGTFRETSTPCGITSPSWNSSAAWGDFNGDGCLDLYLTHYVNWSFDNHPVCMVPSGQREICPPKEFEGLPDQLYISQGDGTFHDSTAEAGLRQDGKGLGVVLADVDNDGDLDIYVANDTVANFLYLNDGHVRFEEVGMLHGVAVDDHGVANGSMGVDAIDYNGDGMLDLWVANYEDETFALYRNEGSGHFFYASHLTGVTSLGQYFVAFGTKGADFDNDGDEDLVVANGHVVKYPQRSTRRQKPLALQNDGGRFVRAKSAGEYFEADHEGRGLATGDLDADGDLDIVVSHVNDPVSLLRNDHASGHWLAVQLIGVSSNRDAIGARLTLETTHGRMVRQVKGGGSYLSSSDLRVFWGVPEGTELQRLVIHWPRGGVQEIVAPPTGRLLTVVERLNKQLDQPDTVADGAGEVGIPPVP